MRCVTCGSNLYAAYSPPAPSATHKAIQITGRPAMKNRANQVAKITAAMPRSGCLSRVAINTAHIAAAIQPPRERGLVRCRLNSQAATTAKLGLRNSEACREKPPRLIQRRAPLISAP